MQNVKSRPRKYRAYGSNAALVKEAWSKSVAFEWGSETNAKEPECDELVSRVIRKQQRREAKQPPKRKGTPKSAVPRVCPAKMASIYHLHAPSEDGNGLSVFDRAQRHYELVTSTAAYQRRLANETTSFESPLERMLRQDKENKEEEARVRAELLRRANKSDSGHSSGGAHRTKRGGGHCVYYRDIGSGAVCSVKIPNEFHAAATNWTCTKCCTPNNKTRTKCSTCGNATEFKCKQQNQQQRKASLIIEKRKAANYSHQTTLYGNAVRRRHNFLQNLRADEVQDAQRWWAHKT